MPEAGDNQSGSEDSDNRVFTEVWKRESTDPVRGILLTPTKAYVGDGNKIIVYDTETKREIGEIVPKRGTVSDISQSRDEQSLFVSCADGTASIINIATGEEVILRGHTGYVNCIIQGEGTDVLTCSYDYTIRRWASSTGECLKVYEWHRGHVYSILYDESTNRIFSASYDRTIVVWNGETGEKIGVMEGHCAGVRSLARVNSATIASSDDDGAVKMWSMATLACIETFSVGGYVNSVAATPDRQYLIYGSGETESRSVLTGQRVHTLSHHRHWVLKVAVSPDGRFLATGGLDCMFHLFGISPPF